MCFVKLVTFQRAAILEIKVKGIMGHFKEYSGDLGMLKTVENDCLFEFLWHLEPEIL